MYKVVCLNHKDVEFRLSDSKSDAILLLVYADGRVEYTNQVFNSKEDALKSMATFQVFIESSMEAIEKYGLRLNDIQKELSLKSIQKNVDDASAD